MSPVAGPTALGFAWFPEFTGVRSANFSWALLLLSVESPTVVGPLNTSYQVGTLKAPGDRSCFSQVEL